MAIHEMLNPRKYVNNVDSGRVIEIFRGDGEFRAVLGEVKQVTLINLEPGIRAGGHVHSVKKEILYVASGWVMGHFLDRATGERTVLHLEAGRKVSLLPGIAHVFINESNTDVQLIEFASLPFDINNQDAEKVEFN